MSPSWRDRIEAQVGPESVRLTHRPRGWRPQAPRGIDVPCVAEGPRPAAAVAALADGLARLGVPRAAVSVCLSHRFVRLALVPGGRELRDEAEREAAARHGLRKVVGDEAQQWRVVLDGEAGRGAAVAAGIEPGLFDGLASALSQAQVRGAAIEPLLSVAVRRCRAALAAGPAWLAVAEPGQVVLAALDRGDWQRLRTHRLRAPLAQELPGLLAQAGLVEGLPELRRLVLATQGLPAPAWPEGGDWDVVTVRLDADPVEAAPPPSRGGHA
ncbi:hypothetical protein V4F39_00745 [Aquincola sp. MAHUQ-54]|uniref:GspL cytoplasmic actin-ATPase-like domain-containing protein n=1 Tax=Aquincola agrisoli TaxID=3119538 RepID=A0AAW9QCQ5_9BURK